MDLHTLAEEYALPPRQLSEAREVLLRHGLPPLEIDDALTDLCKNTRAHGGGVAMFDKLLKGQIAILRTRD